MFGLLSGAKGVFCQETWTCVYQRENKNPRNKKKKLEAFA